MRFYLNIPLPDILLSKIELFEKKWQQTGRSDPHITIIVPREVGDTVLEQEIIESIRLSLEGTNKFPIEVLGPEYFDNQDILKLCVVRSEAFKVCHQVVSQALERIAGSEPEDIAFSNIPNPHITLATRLKSLTPVKQKNLERGRYYPLADTILLRENSTSA